jgi:hypothetical protein
MLVRGLVRIGNEQPPAGKAALERNIDRGAFGL